MSAEVDDTTRDRDTIERELRLLASVRSAYRLRGGAPPPVSQMDALLDELLELGPPVKPKAKAVRPMPSRSPSGRSAPRSTR
ncbi:hypothetical protein [Candidatus Mycobacterium methanotrophicum]|uniref:Anti-sigma factor NepR domain-containing protein n=1 Tax=Candidatus Mycobacterium methanotrophicum TaxID=2943498 RepID=A0ABY4QMP4_9MYCO|nr:hypothetical protein [Candidatus Mycobacterium methanotrophicum]UQX11512.1 hypothetical protein M5I08_03120 [Candidatus Mycobacterium methanotrophicum]